jgi:hypothetical protein
MPIFGFVLFEFDVQLGFHVVATSFCDLNTFVKKIGCP